MRALVLGSRFAAVALLAAVLSAQIAPVAARCAPCDVDVDGDGIAEVESLTLLGGAGDANAAHIVVLVEPRLLAPGVGISADDVVALRGRLDRFAADLGREGYRADLVAAQVYAGERHQDGRTLLGLRRFLQAVAADAVAAHTSLAGAVLVGHFPDALLLRTCNWRRGGAVTLRDRAGADVPLAADVQYLRAVPELVANKCDLGARRPRWRLGGALLRRGDGAAQRHHAVRHRPQRCGRRRPRRCVCRDGGAAPRFVDAFHVHDGRAVVDADAFAVAVDDVQGDFECTAADRAHANAIARPDLAVLRIDARGVAWSPRAEFLADGVRARTPARSTRSGSQIRAARRLHAAAAAVVAVRPGVPSKERPLRHWSLVLPVDATSHRGVQGLRT